MAAVRVGVAVVQALVVRFVAFPCLRLGPFGDTQGTRYPTRFSIENGVLRKSHRRVAAVCVAVAIPGATAETAVRGAIVDP